MASVIYWNNSFVKTDTTVSRNRTYSLTDNGNGTTSCAISEPLGTDFRVALYCLVIIVSTIGNTLVIFVVVRNRRMHSVANYLICNMSIADLLITFLPMTWEVVKLRHYPDGTWPMGAFMCSFTHICIYISVASSILTLTSISLDRFFAVLYPLKQCITIDKLPFLLIAIWIVSFAFASPMIFAQGLTTENNKTYCIEYWKPPFHMTESPKHYTIILFTGLYAVPLLIMSVLYTLIVVKLWRRNIPGNRSSRAKLQALKQKKNVIKMLVCVLGVFAICWFPVFFAQFSFFFNPTYIACPNSFPQWLQFFAFFMQYLGSAVNPFVYFAFSRAFRVGFRSAFKSSSFRRRESNYPTISRSHGRSTRRGTISPNAPRPSVANRPRATSVQLNSLKEKQVE